MVRLLLLAFLCTACFIKNSYAQATLAQEYPQQPYHEKEKESRRPIEPYTKRRDIAETYRSTDILPLFAKQMGLSKDKTPLPFTVMLLGNYLQNSIRTSNFKGTIKTTASINIPVIGNVNIPVTIPIGQGGLLKAGITDVTQRFFTGGLRFGVNILPFWNVYAVFAQSSGTTTSGIQVGNGAPMDFTMAFDASSIGGGTSLAIGGKLFFTSVDLNYVMTDVESIQSMIYTVNASMRIGLYKQYNNESFAMWVGGSYMENIGGSGKLGAIISVERLDDIIANLPFVGKNPANISWLVDQKPENVFSATVGMRYSPVPNFDIVAEVGFIDRVNLMIGAAYNF